MDSDKITVGVDLRRGKDSGVQSGGQEGGGGAWCHGNSLNDLAAVDEELVVDTV